MTAVAAKREDDARWAVVIAAAEQAHDPTPANQAALEEAVTAWEAADEARADAFQAEHMAFQLVHGGNPDRRATWEAR